MEDLKVSATKNTTVKTRGNNKKNKLLLKIYLAKHGSSDLK